MIIIVTALLSIATVRACAGVIPITSPEKTETVSCIPKPAGVIEIRIANEPNDDINIACANEI